MSPGRGRAATDDAAKEPPAVPVPVLGKWCDLVSNLGASLMSEDQTMVSSTYSLAWHLLIMLYTESQQNVTESYDTKVGPLDTVAALVFVDFGCGI